ncbi:MAG: SDR family oxidoreductase [Deltaproteobacteria bacterium]|nr:SDR family oxidoreductase [Deltaproteobacteria bacterium]
MCRNFEDKVVLVTGGAYGIGRAAAVGFAERGARVAFADLDAERAEETLRLIREAGGEAIFVETDVAREEDVRRLVAKTVETYGKLDCAFNNAGIHKHFSSSLDFTERDWDQLVDVNLKGIWLCLKHEIPEMLKRGKGAIVNTSSAAGLVGAPSNPAYPASKHGVVGITKSTALEFARSGIRVNCVCPGPIRTGMFESLVSASPEIVDLMEAKVPMGRAGRPEEVARAAIWLCSDEASYITGHALAVDGGIVAD